MLIKTPIIWRNSTQVLETQNRLYAHARAGGYVRRTTWKRGMAAGLMFQPGQYARQSVRFAEPDDCSSSNHRPEEYPEYHSVPEVRPNIS